MIGIRVIQQLERTKAILDSMGLCIREPKHLWLNQDVMALVPKDADSLPIYSRDAEIFVGNLDDISKWIAGVQWARNYDTMIFGKKHNDNRNRKEQNRRNQQLVDILSKKENNV